jgi:hypothetical protein
VNRIASAHEVEWVLKLIVEAMGLRAVGHVGDRDVYRARITTKRPFMDVEFSTKYLAPASESPEALYDYIFEVCNTARRELAHGLRELADRLDAFSTPAEASKKAIDPEFEALLAKPLAGPVEYRQTIVSAADCDLPAPKG